MAATKKNQITDLQMKEIVMEIRLFKQVEFLSTSDKQRILLKKELKKMNSAARNLDKSTILFQKLEKKLSGLYDGTFTKSLSELSRVSLDLQASLSHLKLSLEQLETYTSELKTDPVIKKEYAAVSRAKRKIEYAFTRRLPALVKILGSVENVNQFLKQEGANISPYLPPSLNSESLGKRLQRARKSARTLS